MLRYKIKAQANTRAAAEIYIYGDIGDSWWEETTSAADFVRDLEKVKNEDITVRINSVGGSVPDGIAIYNALRRHQATVTIAIDGMAYSIASLIAMAGDVVEMAENAMLMIHAPWMVAAGNAAELREYAEYLDSWSDAMAKSYARKSGKTEAECADYLKDGKDHFFTSDQAQDEGFIDSIVEGLAIAASYRVPDKAMSRYSDAPFPINKFLIRARGPNQTQGDSDMTREQKIKATFKGHLAKAGVQELQDACLADGAISVEDAQAKLDELLAKGPVAPEPNPGQPSTASPDAEAIAKAAVAAEAKRRNDIEAAFEPFNAVEGVAAVLKTCVVDTNVSLEIANKRLLDALGKEGEPVGSSYHVSGSGFRAGAAGQDEFAKDAVDALLARAGLGTKEARAAARKNPIRHASLLDLAKASLDRAGISYSVMDSMQVVGAAFTQSGSDFPVLLEEAMHKALLEGYAIRPDTWSRFCRVGSVSDFRAHGRYRTGSIGNFATVNELGEFENKTIPDGEKGSIQIDTRGAIINLSRKAIINDDIGAFINLARDIGRAASRTVEAAVYALLAENSGLGPTMLDGKALFHADHSNIGTGSALTMAGIEADRVLMGSQTDISGNEFLDLRPDVLLVPLSLGGTARSVNDAQYDPDTANKLQKPNIVNGLFSDIVDTPRLTGTRRYLFADPAEAPVIEVAFLNGEQEPQIEMQDAFTVDGTRYRGRLDFGTAAIDHRGASTNAGA